MTQDALRCLNIRVTVHLVIRPNETRVVWAARCVTTLKTAAGDKLWLNGIKCRHRIASFLKHQFQRDASLKGHLNALGNYGYTLRYDQMVEVGLRI